MMEMKAKLLKQVWGVRFELKHEVGSKSRYVIWGMCFEFWWNGVVEHLFWVLISAKRCRPMGLSCWILIWYEIGVVLGLLRWLKNYMSNDNVSLNSISLLTEGLLLLMEGNFGVWNSIFQTLRCKIQLTPNFRGVLCNLS